MTVRHSYSCDLCGSSIGDTNGIGIYHKANGDIEATYLKKDGVGHHLCNSCVKGLRGMLASLDDLAKSQDDYDKLK